MTTVTGQDVRNMVWEDFTSALIETRTGDAEELVDTINTRHGADTAFEDLVMKMNEEWNKWLVGKSEFNS